MALVAVPRTKTRRGAQKSLIQRYWTECREQYPRRFDAEARQQTGVDAVDLRALFDVLVESVEVTALRHATGRWAP